MSLIDVQEPFDAQSFVSRLLGFGDMKGLMQQLRDSQEGSGDPKEMMCVRVPRVCMCLCGGGCCSFFFFVELLHISSQGSTHEQSVSCTHMPGLEQRPDRCSGLL